MQTAQKSNSVEIKKPSLAAKKIVDMIELCLIDGNRYFPRLVLKRTEQAIWVYPQPGIIRHTHDIQEIADIAAIYRIAAALMAPIDVHSDIHSFWEGLDVVTECDRCLLVPSRIRDIAADYADVEVLS